MKKICLSIAALAAMCSSVFAGSPWSLADMQKVPVEQQILHPSQYLVYNLSGSELSTRLLALSQDPAQAQVFSLPMPDGSFRDFRIWSSPMMPQALAGRHPDIHTFSGEAVGNATVTLKAELTSFGFSAMVLDGDNTSFIDPFDNVNDGFYMVHYKRHEVRDALQRMHCELPSGNEGFPGTEQLQIGEPSLPDMAYKTFNGHNLRTYKLALSANNHYCRAATGLSSPTIAQCLAKMTVTMNRVNGIYNRDFSVQMNFCDQEDDIIWPTATGSVNGSDPFNTINNSGGACLGVNQTQCDTRIGSANYDLGHVFTTGGGGISSLGVVCNSFAKAQSCTGSPTPVGDGFDIDYVAHEMGHEFGSQHTFNDNVNGSCAGNAEANFAYEPGSGATIMDYAGICPPDNLQSNSDPYFGASSLVQIQALLATSENVCADITSTGNKLVSLASFSASYKIPYKTPFELTGPTAVDSVADTATTYGWAQWNRGDFGATFANTRLKGPIFRSFNPAYTPTRIFPKLSMVLAGTASQMGEKMPDTARYLTFKMVVRNILNGKGCFVFPDDTVHIDAISTGATYGYKGFTVTSQGSTGVSYAGASSQTVTWDVVGTNAAPVSAANVTISMSLDGGNTWPYVLGTFPNNGSASVTVPNPATNSSNCRFKVKGTGNVFFNVNKRNFTVTNNPSAPITPVNSVAGIASVLDNVKLYPVPATDILNIETGGSAAQALIYNSIGQMVWQGPVTDRMQLHTAAWARGFYYARFLGKDGQVAVRTFVLE